MKKESMINSVGPTLLGLWLWLHMYIYVLG